MSRGAGPGPLAFGGPALAAAAALCGGLALALAIVGCGYQLVRQGELPGGGPLRVAAFKNLTAQAEAAGFFSAAARVQLAARRRLAEEGDEQAAVLEGDLVALRSSTSVLGAAGAGAFRLDAELRLRVRKGDAVSYFDNSSGSEDYLQGVDVAGTEVNRRAALRRLAEAVVRTALERMEAAALLR